MKNKILFKIILTLILLLMIGVNLLNDEIDLKIKIFIFLINSLILNIFLLKPDRIIQYIANQFNLIIFSILVLGYFSFNATEYYHFSKSIKDLFIYDFFGVALIVGIFLLKYYSNKFKFANNYEKIDASILYLNLWVFIIILNQIFLNNNVLTFKQNFLILIIASLLVFFSLKIDKYLRSKFLAIILGAIVIISINIIEINKGFPHRFTLNEYTTQVNTLKREARADQACRDYVGEFGKNLHYCRMMNLNHKNTIAVIGDSHAHVAFTGIANIASKYGYNTVALANSSCPPFIDAEMGSSITKKEKCKKDIQTILDIVINKTDIKQVFIFSRGTKYYTGKGFGKAEENELNLATINKQLFFEGLSKTNNILKNANKIVYYVTENPEIGLNPEMCINRFFKFTFDCKINKDLVLKRQADYLENLGKINDLNILNSITVFCPDDYCLVKKDKLILYSDDDHLSIYGSQFLAEKLIDQVIIKH